MSFKVAVINDTSVTMHYGCERVMKNLRKLLTSIGMDVSFLWPVGEKLTDNDLPTSLDLIIVNGEGTLHHDADRERVGWLLEVPMLAKKRNCPAVLINATIYKNSDSFYENIKCFDSIWCRDTYSQDLLRSKGVNSKYCPDLTMIYELKPCHNKMFRKKYC
ncbi:hypothetical protein ABA45_11795 [Marinobacter psychrophilus]|uniref:Polysaccharide pyruvyl transferase domain-containing protein n=1 Tax=Marinobacter psychrophilus TaxID=330734 RepID=A0A0H4I216_9GAMM|nr:polysaccharide pyruvyl transferase family protein [Marinobacter psychrophilus]AKO52999.1 hypothetical protein ABA45_11795 [Marinobacter psychrophilus]